MSTWLIMALAAGVLFLGIRLLVVRRTLKSIARQLADRTALDSNALIRLSYPVRYLENLCESLNESLKELRYQKRLLEGGDRDFREALLMWAHDLRTPLTALSGYTELLEQEPLTDSASRYIRAMRSRVHTLEEITEELLTFALLRSDREDLKIETIDLKAMVEETGATFYDAFLRHGIHADIDLSKTQVLADRSAVVRILYNLFSNAVKHGTSEVAITLTPDDGLRFVAKDVDIDTLDFAALSGRYFSVARTRGTSGIGLAVVRVLTEKMGGTFSGSAVNGQLEISVQLPKAQSSPTG